MSTAAPSDDVARGPGPWWWRLTLVGLAIVYYLLISLVNHEPKVEAKLPRAITFFTQATQLFASSDRHVIEYHLEGWSCQMKAWEPLDPRPSFPVHAEDKESRFQRVAHFYEEDPGTHGAWIRPVMRALEKFLIERHVDGADDGIVGPIGGIHVFKTLGPIPDPGDDIARYEYRPLARIAAADQTELYHTPESHRTKQCDAGHAIDYASRDPNDASKGDAPAGSAAGDEP